jgi:antitoxin (DNA-binding transcriptional repressor) of toxin-antitoxin stability system
MKTESEVRTLGAGKFKATCLQLMDEVLDKGLTVIITKRGKAVAQLSAPTGEPPAKMDKPEKAPKTPKTPKVHKRLRTKVSEPAGAPQPTITVAASEEKHGKKKDKGKKKKHK